MNLRSFIFVALLFALVLAQPNTLSFNQTVATQVGANSTITGPIFVGPTASDGIITSYGPTISYWTRNAAGAYISNQTWAPLGTSSYLGLAREFNGAQGFGAAASGIQSANIFELTSGVYGAANQTLLYGNDTVGAYNITAIRFNTIGTKLATGNSDGSINIWSRNSSTNAYTSKQKLTAHTAPIKQLGVGSNYTIISLDTNGNVFNWQYEPKNDSYYLLTSPTIANVTCVAVCSYEDNAYFTGLKNGSIVEFRWDNDANQFKVFRTYNGNHSAPVDGISVSKTCNRMVSTANNLILWNFNYTSNGYDEVGPSITGFDPAGVTQSPTQVAVAVNGTGEYKVYSILLNCSNVANAASQLNSTACTCNANYTWKDEFCYRINCSQYTNTTTLYNATACNCVSGFDWNFAASKCQINCAAIENSNGTRQNNNWTCSCNGGYVWNATTSTCRLYCDNIKYTKSSTRNSDGSCQCASGYRWEKSISQCVSSKSNKSVAIGLGVGLGLGIPLLAGLIGLLFCMGGPSVPPMPMAPLPPAAVSATHLVTSTPGTQFVTRAVPQVSTARVATPLVYSGANSQVLNVATPAVRYV